jgi:hypothetical protein
MSDKEHEAYRRWEKDNNIPKSKQQHDLIKQEDRLLVLVLCEDTDKVSSKTVASLMSMDFPEKFSISIDYVSLDNMQKATSQFHDYSCIFVIRDGLKASEEILRNMLTPNKDMIVVESPIHDDFGCMLVKRMGIDKLTKIFSEVSEKQINTVEKKDDSTK